MKRQDRKQTLPSFSLKNKQPVRQSALSWYLYYLLVMICLFIWKKKSKTRNNIGKISPALGFLKYVKTFYFNVLISLVFLFAPLTVGLVGARTLSVLLTAQSSGSGTRSHQHCCSAWAVCLCLPLHTCSIPFPTLGSLELTCVDFGDVHVPT